MFAQHLDPATGENEFGYRPGAAASARWPARLRAPRRSSGADARVLERDPNDPTTWGRVGRNEPCPCGSGKKYKHCHGRYA